MLPVGPDTAVRSGAEPLLIRLDDAASEVNYAAALIETWLRGGVEIDGRHQRIKTERDRRALSKAASRCFCDGALCDRLNGFSRAVVSVWVDSPTGTLQDEAVKILSMHSARGLQFRIVLLLWTDMLGARSGSADEEVERRPSLRCHDACRGRAGDPAFRGVATRCRALPCLGANASIVERHRRSTPISCRGSAMSSN